MPDLPPTPKPGEVWENDDGERRFVNAVDDTFVDFKSCGVDVSITTRISEWKRLWAIRTNARRILEAPKK